MSEPAVIERVESGFRLSPQQRRLWTLREQGEAVAQSVLLLDGLLEVLRLERALQGLVNRHEILRTTFHRLPGMKVPVQRVSPAGEMRLRTLEVGGECFAGLIDAWIDEQAAAEASRPFDLDREPALRALLVRRSASRHFLILTLPTLCADRESLRVVAKEAAGFYAAAPDWPELDEPFQYADFAEWQNELLEGSGDQEAGTYWRDWQAGGILAPALPATRRTGSSGPPEVRALPLHVDAEVLRELEAVASWNGCSLVEVLLAAWQALLGGITGEPGVMVGVVCDGRKYEQLEGTLGPCARTLPVLSRSAHPDDRLTFGEFLRDVAEVMRNARELQEFFDPEQGLDRDTDPSAQLGCLFDFDGKPTSFAAAGIAFSVIRRSCLPGVFDLALTGDHRNGGLALEILYQGARYAPDGMSHLMDCLATLLGSIAAAPESPLEELELLSESMRHQVAVAWNATEAEYPGERCIDQLVEIQAGLTPEAVAVVYRDQEVLYGELDRRANQLAHALRRRGVGPEVAVGLCLERGVEMVVAMLAIWKAGGAYVALDPEAPSARWDIILRASQARVVLTQEALLQKLAGFSGEVVCLARERAALAGERADRPARLAVPDNLAYVVFTSGSTGAPKGVLASHRGVVSYLTFLRSAYGLGSEDKVLQLASLPFDASVRDIIGPLVAGATVVLVDRAELRDPGVLLGTIRMRGVTAILSIVPSLLRTLADAAAEGNVPYDAVRIVLVSGERLYLSDCDRAQLLFGQGVVVVNQYGPTECTMTSSYHRTSPGEAGREVALLGRPIANTKFYLLGRGRRLMPVGVTGELHIAGTGLARGYLGLPDLTAERFLPDPYGAEPGARMYRTGDLIRLLPDGNFEFLGRSDHQVKIRGFRIEPGEIEAALSRHPAVREVAVLAWGDGSQDVRLVAYVGAGRATQPEPSELRAFLEERLPAYMVPAGFVFLPSLPLTANGKVDRQALPAPETCEAAKRRRVAPRTPVEGILEGIWADVLGSEQVSVEDDFFGLGGHSLLATQVMARVRSAFEVELPLQTIFERSTLAGLAERIDDAMRSGGGLRAPRLERVPHGDRVPLSFAQERLWFLSQLEPESPAYNIPIALRLEGRLDLPSLDRSLTELLRRHESLRTTYELEEGQAVQVIHPPALWKIQRVDLITLSGEDQERETQRLMREELRRPFDLAVGPLTRAMLVHLGKDDHRAVFTIHHIVSDAWSTGVLVREMSALYRSFQAGESPALPELPIQYADYALWQRSWLSGEVMAGHIAYWRERLRGVAALELPTDRPRPIVLSPAGAVRFCAFPPAAAARQAALCRHQGATLFMAFLAGFAGLLHRYTGRDDVVLGTPVAGRNMLETEVLIGCLVNTLVLRTDLSGDPSFRDLLRRVRKIAIEAHSHQDVPFEWLADELETERTLNRTPLFQVMLSLQNTPSENLELPGVRLTQLPTDNGTAKFDLELNVRQVAEGIAGSMTYSTDLYDASTVDRLLGHLVRFLEAAAREPDQRISCLSLLSEAERQQLVVEWNAASGSCAIMGCALRRIAVQAERTPAAVAAVCGENRLTYGELLQRAGRLAAGLVAEGVGRGTIVCLLAERGIDFVTAMLGLFASGAAYLPLDPRHPAQRLAQMVDQSGSPLVLAAGELRPLLSEALAGMPAERRPRVLDLGALLLRPGAAWKAACCDSGDLAYVIYTSGSTGVPKGVMVEHRGMLNHLGAKVDDLVLTAADVVAQTASQTFDISIWQFLAALLVGGRVHIVSDEVAHDPTLLLDEVERAGVSVLETVPSLLRALLDEVRHRGASAPALSSLRWLVPTGEVLPAELCREWLRHYPRVPLLNAYGPTECSDDVSHHILRQLPEESCARIPIGRALSNLALYVLDQGLWPLPALVPGELCVGGTGVGLGYLGDPGATAARFVPDPFAGIAGGRMYRTGDLARCLPDGTVDFLGRLDHQVKIRGFRVELQEIEAVLVAHPAVGAAAVVARTLEETNDLRLVAYVVPDPGQEDSRGEVLDPWRLRSYLAGRLPDYMIPAAFVTLEALPLTPNGKLDREALPAPALKRDPGETSTELRSLTEELLAAIWVLLLGAETIERRDSFFALGGHSLLATRLLSHIREVFRVELPLRTVFEEPTLAGLASRIERASREGAGLEIASIPPLRSAPRDRDLPLSFAQQRLWFLDQLEPGNPMYNVPTAVRLHGKLDVEVLAHAFSEIVRRHEVLRTTFATVQGAAVQLVGSFRPQLLPVTDLMAIPEPAREREALDRASEESRRPFDLAAGPLLRMSLLRLGREDHVLLVTMHHVVSDGWSIEILIREVVTLYRAFLVGKPSPLPELPVQYADFAVWQREWLSGEVLERHLDYWRRQLAGAPPVLDLPTDRPRPPVMSYHGASHRFELPESLTQSLAELSRSQGTTLFMTLLAAFQVLLSRYSGQEDLCVGAPVAGRTQLETENLIGFLVNTLVLRGDLTAEPTFRQLLARVREVALDAHTYQHLPFEKLVEELRPERTLSHAPLFQVVCVLQNVPHEALELPGLALAPFGGSSESAKFDLVLSLQEVAHRLAGSLVHSTDLFDASTAERMARHLSTLLEELVADPDAPVSATPLLAGGERQATALPWSAALTAYPVEACLHELVVAQVERRPGAVAAVCEGEVLTYGGLQERALRLAGRLRPLGVGPEVVVGLCAERSLDMLVGILGILHAGGAYLPLDPAYPKERLAYMVSDSGTPVVLAQRGLLGRLPETTARVVLLDEGLAAEGAAELPASGVLPDHPAYVIYTSGSTGRPKGVIVSHANVVRLFRSTEPWFGFSERDIWTLFHSYAFDFSVWEIWGALLYGGQLAVVPHLVSRSPEAFYELLCRERVTVLNQTPSAFSQLIAAEPEGARDRLALRAVIFGGEALDLRSLRPWFDLHGDHRPTLINMYGITETTVHVTYRPVFRKDVETASGSLIGRPLPDLELFILDRNRQPVPPGVVGEMYVGGAGLSRGYLGRPDLTADRFVPHPFGDRPGERLYRTGDLARGLSSGDVQYLGRIDSQVKIRGFRIELGEIEATLSAHPQIRQTIVLAREGPRGERRLVAYVVTAPGADLAVGELRDLARRRLPEYMVPADFVLLDRLPLTSNGKVDRRALPELAVEPREREDGEEAPRTPLEETLAAIWSNLLGRERVGSQDNFFNLGGHSLLTTQLSSRIRQVFHAEMPLQSLFEHPVLADMAAVLERAIWAKAAHAVPPPGRALTPRAGAIPLSVGQQRLWILQQLDPASPVFNLPTLVRLTGRIEVRSLEGALGEVCRRHESLRTTFQEIDGGLVQIIQQATPRVLPLIDLTALPRTTCEPEVERLILTEVQRSFDLVRGPLLHMCLFRTSEEAHILLYTTHHIVSDEWSLAVLRRELVAIYQALAAGRPLSLREPSLQHADYTLWQQGWLESEACAAELAYWRHQLAGPLPVLELPTQRPRPAVPSYRGARLSFAFPEQLSRALKVLSRRESATLFMTLLASFKALLHWYTGQDEIIVGTNVANRGHLALEGLIGNLSNVLALRTDVSGDPSFRELLGRVRDVALAAYGNQKIPFEVLLAELRPDRRETFAPLFQTMFVWHQAAEPSDVLAKIAAVNFDLTLVMAEAPGGLWGSLEYASDLFEDQQMGRLLTDFQALLSAVTEDPELRIGAVLQAEDFQTGMEDFNADLG
jgi:amino acid adenylation domain-containing protein